MDLETLINIVLVFFFLLITTLVRVLKSKTKKKPGIKQKQSQNPLFSFFQKIRDQIQESLQELEKQARQQQTSSRQTMMMKLIQASGRNWPKMT